MKNPISNIQRQVRQLATAGLLASSIFAATGQTAFTDDFNRDDVNTGTTLESTAIGNGWSFYSDSQSPQRGGAQIVGNILQIGQASAGGYAGAGGGDRSWLWQDTHTWAGPYTSTLKDNPRPVVWTFNLRTGQSNPTPVSTSGGGTVAVFLACGESGTGDWQFGGNANGYFVTFNSSGTVDPLRLVRTSAGLRQDGSNSTNNLHTPIITASAPVFNDLSSQFLSVKVTYDPASDQWQLFARDDGNSFQNPTSGSLTYLGSGIDGTYTSTPLRYSGFLANSNNGFNSGADENTFDNFTVTVINQAEAPVFNPPGGTYGNVQNVTIHCTPGDATIHYTTDGSPPTNLSPIYTGPVAITGTTTLSAISVKAGLAESSSTSAQYIIKTATPVLTPAGGSFPDTQVVTITTATPGATIRYTTDGTEPTPTTGIVYTIPIEVAADTSVIAIAYKDGFEVSELNVGFFSIKTGSPVFNPPASTFNSPQMVTITSATLGATIRYTLDGSEPTTTTGMIYTNPIDISTATTVKAIAYKSGIPESDIISASYVIQAGSPVFSPPGANYINAQSVTITSSTADAIIRYTTNGDDPTTSSGTIYTAPIEINESMLVKAIAYKAGVLESDISSADYVLQAGTPEFSPPPSTYNSAQLVTISTLTTGATIRYTTDGSEPTLTSGTIYTSPVAIDATATLKAIAYKTGYGDSGVKSGDYLIDTSFSLVFEDTFSDGDYTNGADVLDSQWRIHSNVAPTTKAVVNGKLEIGRSGANGNGFNPGAITTFPSQTIAVGQTIELSLEFSSSSTTANATGFRFGLYNSGGTNLTADLVGNPPGTGTTFQNDVGFSVFAPARQTGNVALYIRNTTTTNNSLQIGTAPNGTAFATNSLTTATAANTTYNASLSIERVTTNTYNLVAKYAGVTVTRLDYTPAVATNVFDSLSVFSIQNANAPYEALFLDNFRVTVTTPQPPSSLATWRTLHGLAADGSQDGANPSGDGVENLLKYALNLAPNAGDLALPNAKPLPNPNGSTVVDLTGLPVVTMNDTPTAIFTYIRRKPSSSPGITYSVQWSDELTGWAVNPLATETTLSLDSTWERVTLTDSFTTTEKPSRFARLKVATP